MHARMVMRRILPRPIRRLGLALLTLASLGAAARADAALRAAWVELGPGGQALARVITTAPTCPTLRLDGADVAMTVRAPAAVVAQRPTRSAPAESKPSAFPVTTCEATLPAGARHATVGGRTLPLPTSAPRRIVVIGDTGCRMKQSEGAFQPCDDARGWPFKTVATRAAAAHPDLVIHLGDLHYRENACPPATRICAGSPWGYGYDTFEADFFTPAARLLAAAPWVFVRGNHESCDRAGQGWWRFFDPRPVAAGRDCNAPRDDATGDVSEPYAVPLGDDAQLIVFDSSRAGIARLASGDPLFAAYTGELERVVALARQAPTTFFASHHPALAFSPRTAAGKLVAIDPGNPALQSAMEAVLPGRLFPETVQATFSGHVHVFQMTSFTTDHPAAFLSGNAGSWSESPNYDGLPPGATPYAGATVAQSISTNQYGFLVLTHDGAGWLATAYDRAGAILTTCTLAGRKAHCDKDQLANANR